MNCKIKKGNHYCRHWPKFHFGETNLIFRFKFGLGCWFPLVVPDDHARNKLCGLSHGFHHQNSVRVGWTPSKRINKIDLFFYLYMDGKRFEKYFDTVEVGELYEMDVDVVDDLVSFNLMQNYEPIAADSVSYKLPWFRWGAILFPFLGGKLPARVDTYIDLTII